MTRAAAGFRPGVKFGVTKTAESEKDIELAGAIMLFICHGSF
jgi:hypothetical protein